jgi:autotransporter passenger strand-loop-strand repeat protein
MTTTITGTTSVTANGGNYLVDPNSTLIIEEAAGGGQTVFVTSVTVDSAGALVIQSGGITEYVLLSGTETIATGGSDYFATISNGAAQYDSGTAFGATLLFGGNQLISGIGAYAENTFISRGGEQAVYSGAEATGDTVSSGGMVFVSNGGSAYNTNLLSGGEDFVFSGGTAEFTSVGLGADEIISSGGVASLTTLGTSQSTGTGSAMQYVDSGGTAYSTLIRSGGVQYIKSGGAVFDATLSFGGIQTIRGGTASDTQIDGGANAYLDTGKSISASVIGSFYVSAGTAYGTSATAGGNVIVSSAGRTFETTLGPNGYETIYDHGSAVLTTINDGGALNVGARV